MLRLLGLVRWVGLVRLERLMRWVGLARFVRLLVVWLLVPYSCAAAPTQLLFPIVWQLRLASSSGLPWHEILLVVVFLGPLCLALLFFRRRKCTGFAVGTPGGGEQFVGGGTGFLLVSSPPSLFFTV